MRFLVPINPGDLLTGFDGYGLRIKSKVFDFYLVFLATRAAGVLHLAAQGEEGEIEKCDAAQECRRFIFANECSHKLSDVGSDLAKVGIDNGEGSFALLILNAR